MQAATKGAGQEGSVRMTQLPTPPWTWNHTLCPGHWGPRAHACSLDLMAAGDLPTAKVPISCFLNTG